MIKNRDCCLDSFISACWLCVPATRPSKTNSCKKYINILAIRFPPRLTRFYLMSCQNKKIKIGKLWPQTYHHFTVMVFYITCIQTHFIKLLLTHDYPPWLKFNTFFFTIFIELYTYWWSKLEYFHHLSQDSKSSVLLHKLNG